jgi:hypothetical protein
LAVMIQSIGFKPAAVTCTRSWPGPACGSGTSRIASSSGPPNECIITALLIPNSIGIQPSRLEKQGSFLGRRVDLLLQGTIKKGTSSARTITRARILLKADSGIRLTAQQALGLEDAVHDLLSPEVVRSEERRDGRMSLDRQP